MREVISELERRIHLSTVYYATSNEDTIYIYQDGDTIDIDRYTDGDRHSSHFDPSKIDVYLEIFTGKDDDTVIVTNDIDVPLIIRGGQGDDYFSGSDENDFLIGGIGNDTLIGNSGDDYIDGAGDRDVIRGVAGNDTLLGGANSDTIYGGGSGDSINGGTGDDYIYGGAGHDSIFAGDGEDVIDGGDDGDLIGGGNNNDTIYGNNGEDSLAGDDGNDLIYGGNDDDLIAGNTGDDTIYGDFGNDTIYGGPGEDARPFTESEDEWEDFNDHEDEVIFTPVPPLPVPLPIL